MRITLLLRVLVVLFVSILLTIPFTAAGVGGGALASQDATPVAPDYSDHPYVGSWSVDIQPENPENHPHMVTIFPNGTLLDSAPDGTNGHGLWEPTGPDTAILTFLLIYEDGFQVLVRATAEVAPDGQTFTSPYTNEFFNPAIGEWSGEIGPGTAEGTRLELQAPGTPVASFEEFFAGPEGTPDATPAT